MTSKIMGIVNVTPDSFSDGGRFFKPEEAIRRTKNMLDEGADIIDFGAESTRPGATELSWEEEWARLDPVLSLLPSSLRHPPAFLSIDTYHPETAERALAKGANMINCVHSKSIPEIAALCTKKGADLVVPWRLGWTKDDCGYTLDELRTQGLDPYLDPMIGFGTDRDEDLKLLRSLPELAKLGRVLIGASRKRIVKKLTGEKVTGKNLGGNLGIAVWCALHGASVVRVHDVAETVQALRVTAALEGDAPNA